MSKNELCEILELVKDKLHHEIETACGLFWPDTNTSSRYSVGEEDVTTHYGVGEEDSASRYAVGEH